MSKMKARIEMKEGTVELEGEPEAISNIILTLQMSLSPKRTRKSLRQLIVDLMADSYLDQPRTLTEIRDELEQRGHKFTTNTLFPVMYRDFLKKNIISRRGERRKYRYYVSHNKIPTEALGSEKTK